MSADCLDVDLARIVSYLTFDGHLGKRLNYFYLSSADVNELKFFESLVTKRFGLTARYEDGSGFGVSYKCKFNSKKTGEILFSLGVPKGDKMLCAFRVPNWIKANREFSRVYLSTAFQCEGWISRKNNADSYSLGFKIFKSEELLQDGLLFVEDLIELLKSFGVATSRVWLQPGNLRNKDGKKTIAMAFSVRTKSLPVFDREIRFGCDAVKNGLLHEAAKKYSKTPGCYQNALWFNDFRKNGEQPENWRVTLPKQSNVNLAKLVAYVMRYGNIIRNFKQFYVVSSSERVLTDFARIIEEEFDLRVPYATKTSKRNYRCLVCSRKIVCWLIAEGLPCGKSALRSFTVPEWIKNNEEHYTAFSRVFNA